MILFTQTTLLIGRSDVPIGAYSMYIIPGERQWTLIVNKNVDVRSRYDKLQDILRTNADRKPEPANEASSTCLRPHSSEAVQSAFVSREDRRLAGGSGEVTAQHRFYILKAVLVV
jgi:Protein of unknown function (DUF2911)